MIPRVKATGLLIVSAVLLATTACSQDTTGTWRGLVVAPENRCSPYDRQRDYPYPQSIEQDIVRHQGACTARTRIRASLRPARRTSNTSWRRARRTTRDCTPGNERFASALPPTLRNLRLASTRVNRHQKKGGGHRGAQRIGATSVVEARRMARRREG
jgi:hypothetical protein